MPEREEESEREKKKEAPGRERASERRGRRRRRGAAGVWKVEEKPWRCLPEPRVEKLFRRRLLNGRRSFAEHIPRCAALHHFTVREFTERIFSRAREGERERERRMKKRARARKLPFFFRRFIFISKFVVNLSATIYCRGTLRANESDSITLSVPI